MNNDTQTLFKVVLQRVQKMLTAPQATWKEVAAEPGGLKELFVPYGIAMFLIPAAITLIQGLVTPIFAARMALYMFLVPLLMTVVMGLAMTAMAPLFHARKSFIHSCRVLVYAGTPLCVFSVLGILPILGSLLGLLAIPWVIILLYMGIGIVLETKGARQILFLIGIFLVYALVASVPMSMIMARQSALPSRSSSGFPTAPATSEAKLSPKVLASLEQMEKDARDSGMSPEAAKEYRNGLQKSLTPDQIKTLESEASPRQ